MLDAIRHAVHASNMLHITNGDKQYQFLSHNEAFYMATMGGARGEACGWGWRCGMWAGLVSVGGVACGWGWTPLEVWHVGGAGDVVWAGLEAWYVGRAGGVACGWG